MGLASRDSYCGVKSPFLSDWRLILTHIVVSKDSYWLILWCQKSISEWFETHIVVSKVHFWVIWESGKFGLKKGTGVDPRPPLVDNVPFFYRFFFMRASLSSNLYCVDIHGVRQNGQLRPVKALSGDVGTKNGCDRPMLPQGSRRVCP